MNYLGSKRIETRRLILHKTEERDLKELWSILCLDEVNKYYLIAPLNYDWEKEKVFQYKKLKNSGNSDVFCWTIEEKDTKEIIGQINLFSKEKKDIFDIGWFLEPSFQKKGYAYEASLEVLKYMFLEVGISGVYTSAAINNPSSWKLMEKLGFKRENNTIMVKYTNVLEKVENYQYRLTKKDFLKEMFRKEELYISESIDKEPYIKHISSDPIINVTGESGSGKSTLCEEYINDDNYIVIDTDLLYDNSNNYYKDFRDYLINKYQKMPDLIKEFDLVYQEIINYYSDSMKWIVIDSAQYRNIGDYSLLKGEVIVLRTCIDTCYRRCLKRFDANHSTFEMIEYSKRKKNIYKWYHALNHFIDKVDKL